MRTTLHNNTYGVFEGCGMYRGKQGRDAVKADERRFAIMGRKDWGGNVWRGNEIGRSRSIGVWRGCCCVGW